MTQTKWPPEKPGRFSGVSTVVLTHQGQVAGGIADPSVQRLRECLTQGTQYTATVRTVNGGLVTVRIAPVPGT